MSDLEIKSSINDEIEYSIAENSPEYDTIVKELLIC